MCEFCSQHGDGKIWYKNAKNYADDLSSDLKRRRYIQEFLETTIGEGIDSLGRLETIYQKKKRLPARLVQGMVDKAKEEHFGQVVPIEDIRSIIDKAATIVRLPCACRWAAEKKENRCCYSVSYSTSAWYEDLDMDYFGSIGDQGFEKVSGKTAIEQMKALEKHGAVHTIWTMITPFIGAICNCTNHECLGLRTLSMDVETLAKSEYIANVDETLCNGCGNCREACRFGAIGAKSTRDGAKATIDPGKCYGCGLCRIHCPREALRLG